MKRKTPKRSVPAKIVFLFDVDNTLLDNDRVTTDLKHHLEKEVGRKGAQCYWNKFERLREELGYAIISAHCNATAVKTRTASPHRLPFSDRLSVFQSSVPKLARRRRASEAMGPGSHSVRPPLSRWTNEAFLPAGE